jgi:hypothetical protein
MNVHLHGCVIQKEILNFLNEQLNSEEK